jgi:hypothetical protein
MFANPLAEQREQQGAPSRARRPAGSRTAMIRRLQEQQGEEPCFRTEQRLLCERYECQWRGECRRLVAAWKR